MERPQAKGWCPTTLAPMQSGDGLIVRIKPAFGRLTSAQAKAVADLARLYGNGFLDITSRANIQIRGVDEARLPSLISALQGHDLASTDEARDRLNLILAPFTDETMIGYHCAMRLYEAAASLPELPAKFGFAIDTGEKRMIANASADIRIETDQSGALILRCDGCDTGFQTSLDRMIVDIQKVLAWYLAQKQEGARLVRMAKYAKAQRVPKEFRLITPNEKQDNVRVGASKDAGFDIIGVPFGQCHADSLSQLAMHTKQIQVTVNRCFVVDRGAGAKTDFITTPDDGRLAVMACPGAPACASATMTTRVLAETLASRLTASAGLSSDKTYHISGCTKGCAAPRATDFCIIGDGAHYAIIENGCAWEPPSITSLSSDDVLKIVK